MGVPSNAEKLLDFSDLSLKLNNSSDVEFMKKDIMSNIFIETLNLSGNTLGVDAAQAIGSTLCNCSRLTRCLFHDLFTGRLKSEIAPALVHLSTGIMASGCKLVELNLSDNAFGPNGVVGVTELLASPTCYTLKILRMNNQGLGHEGCRYLSQALEKGFKESGGRGLRLKVFSAGRNRLENVGVQLLSDVFSQMGSLEELALYQNGIGIHGLGGIVSLVKMLHKNTSLRILDLSDNSLTPKGGEAFAEILKSLNSLEELHLNDCILRSAGVCALARALEDPEIVPCLRVLHVTGNEIKRDAGISLVLSLAKRSDLKSLDLNTNEFGSSGIRALIQVCDSVGLLHALPIGAGGDAGEPVGEDRWLRAFDDDQGSQSGSEDGEEGGEELEGEEEEEEHGAKAWGEESDTCEEERYEYEHVTDEEEADSLDIQKEEKVNFSFRELEKKLVGGGCNAGANSLQSLAQSVDGGRGERRNPFGSNGLFSGLSPPNHAKEDTTDAASLRAKLQLTSSASLFANSPIVPASRPGHIFSPPFLSNLGTTAVAVTTTKAVVSPANSSAPSREMANGSRLRGSSDLSSLEAQLARCLSCSNTEDDMARELVDCLRVQTSGPTVGRLIQLSRDVSPERVVRLSLRLACDHRKAFRQQQHAGGGDEAGDRLARFAVDLLASALTDSSSGGEERQSRAVNCLLVHLRAVKAEPDSLDDLGRRPAAEQQRHLIACLELTRRLLMVHTGSQLSPDIRNYLTFCLSEQRQKQALTQSSKAAGSHDDAESVGQLQKDLLDLLVGGMTSLRLGTAM